eukprot:NODE_66_length_23959_cov_0.323009.p6 type:complete len:348 gc:universal NODE_66_length_23959_cov_0.323009:11203-10160(-)
MLRIVQRFGSNKSDKSTFRVFKESLNKQIQQSENMRTNLKQIADTRSNLPKFNIPSPSLQRTRKIVDQLQQSPIGKSMSYFGKTMDDISEHPLIKSSLTSLYQEAIHFGGMPPRELREVYRARKKSLPSNFANSDSTELAASKTWNVQNPFSSSIDSLSKSIDNSNSTALLVMRDMVQNTVNFFSGVFSQSDQSKLVTEIRSLDPQFHPDIYLQDCRALFIPEIIESMLEGNKQRLSEWMTEASLNMVNQIDKEFKDKGLHNDSKLLEVRETQLVKMEKEQDRILLLLASTTDELTIYRDKDKKIVHGSEESIQSYRYVFVMALDENSVKNPVTRGWKVVQYVKQNK